MSRDAPRWRPDTRAVRGGLARSQFDETAEAMGLSRRTVLREWAFARARLYAALQGEVHGDG